MSAEHTHDIIHPKLRPFHYIRPIHLQKHDVHAMISH